MGRRRFRTIEGRIIERDIGEAVIECFDERVTCMVVFAEGDDAKCFVPNSISGGFYTRIC